MRELNAILAIGYRDFLKFYRDRTRVIGSFIFPLIFIGVLGTSLQANIGQFVGFNFITFAFTGVLAQLVFQIVAFGLISMNEERDQNLTQEIFVSPVSRYSIVIGKILGETVIAMLQAAAVLLFGLVIGVPMTLQKFLTIGPLLVAIAFLGGTFGLLVVANLRTQRSAQQLFPLFLFPQFFLAGVFSPIKSLPVFLLIPSRIVPLTYAVDLVRSVFYRGAPEAQLLVLHSPLFNFSVILVVSIVFLVLGTWLFVRNEKNR